jgi:hypothetical protein
MRYNTSTPARTLGKKENAMAALIEKLDPGTTSDGIDLKRRLAEHFDVIKRPNDLVRITQVSRHHFRVNVLSPWIDGDNVLNTFRIVKSQFLHVEDRHGELVITDQTRH